MRPLRLLALVLLAALPGAPALPAQLITAPAGQPLPTFEVATIKPNRSGENMRLVRMMSDLYVVTNLPLRDIIGLAWGLHSHAQLAGGPSGLLDQSFDVSAKLDPADVAALKSLSRDDRQHALALRLQALLEDRFALQVHIESRQLSEYDLVVAKGGAKLHAAPPLPPPNPDAPPPSPPAPGQPPPKLGRGSARMMMTGSGVELAVDSGTLDQLAAMLSRSSQADDRIVVNQTGLNGLYDYTLRWSPDDRPPMPAGNNNGIPADQAAPDPPLPVALREQLGLELVPAKGPVQVLVIDHLAPPTPN